MDPNAFLTGLKNLGDEWIHERGSARLQKERNDYYKERHQDLVNQAEQLVAQINDLKNENHQLRQENSSLKTASQAHFVEHQGVKFKRNPSGGFHQAVYCPECSKPMSVTPGLPYGCDRCNQWTEIMSSNLPALIREVEAKYS